MTVQDILAIFPGSEVVTEVPQADSLSFQAQARAIREWNEWISVLAEDREEKALARSRRR